VTASYRGEQLSHDISFPGESAPYLSARNELLHAEIALRRQAEEVAAQRRALPLEGEIPKDYTFEEWDAAAGAARQRLLSSADTTYNADYRAESPDGMELPIATVFTRRDGRIHHVWSSELLFAPTDPGQNPRHVDFLWPLWAMFDHTRAGRAADWYPALEYG